MRVPGIKENRGIIYKARVGSRNMGGNGAKKEYVLSGLLDAGIKIHTSKRATRNTVRTYDCRDVFVMSSRFRTNMLRTKRPIERVRGPFTFANCNYAYGKRPTGRLFTAFAHARLVQVFSSAEYKMFFFFF